MEHQKHISKDFEKVCTIISEINIKVGISVECSLGFLTTEQAKKLKDLKEMQKVSHPGTTSPCERFGVAKIFTMLAIFLNKI